MMPRQTGANMTKHQAISKVVHALRAAGIPIYNDGGPRLKSTPGVAVRLGWRNGTLDVMVYDGGATLDQVRAAIGGGWREVYTNEAGAMITIAPA